MYPQQSSSAPTDSPSTGPTPQALPLMVTFSDGSQMSLLDWLKQADSIPPDATVKVGDQTMTGAEYQAWVKSKVDAQLTAMEKVLDASVEDFSNLASEMWFQGGEVSSIWSDLEARMHGIDAAIGNDDGGNKFKQGWNDAFGKLKQSFGNLQTNLNQFGGGMYDASTYLYQCEELTLEGFGQTHPDPRYPQGRGGHRYF